jgi:hypothetical protein
LIPATKPDEAGAWETRVGGEIAASHKSRGDPRRLGCTRVQKGEGQEGGREKGTQAFNRMKRCSSRESEPQATAPPPALTQQQTGSNRKDPPQDKRHELVSV